jgi:hypothetical protein
MRTRQKPDTGGLSRFNPVRAKVFFEKFVEMSVASFELQG